MYVNHSPPGAKEIKVGVLTGIKTFNLFLFDKDKTKSKEEKQFSKRCLSFIFIKSCTNFFYCFKFFSPNPPEN